MEKINMQNISGESRIKRDFKLFGVFLKRHWIGFCLSSFLLIVSILGIYFFTWFKNNPIAYLFFVISFLAVIAFFIILFITFKNFELSEYAKKDTEGAVCFFAYFSSLFFAGIILTVIFLFVKLANSSNQILIQGIPFITGSICIFLFYGLATYLHKLAGLFKNKNKKTEI